MAYTKTDWACGDKITAEKLNKIEQGIVDAQNGYECTESWTTLTEETVTTVQDGSFYAGALEYSEWITADKIKVTFNGTEYMCNRTEVTSGNDTLHLYGGVDSTGYDFSVYPFAINSTKDELDTVSNRLYVPSAGTYTVKIETVEESVTTTSCFQKAVKSVASGGRLIKKVGASSCNSDYNEYDISLNEVKSLLSQGTPMMIETTSSGETVYQQVLFCHTSVDSVSFVVANADISGSDPSTTLTSGILYSNNGADAHMDSGYCSGPL